MSIKRNVKFLCVDLKGTNGFAAFVYALITSFFVSALEAPISEHESLPADIPEAARTQPIVQLALKELWARASMV